MSAIRRRSRLALLQSPYRQVDHPQLLPRQSQSAGQRPRPRAAETASYDGSTLRTLREGFRRFLPPAPRGRLSAATTSRRGSPAVEDRALRPMCLRISKF
jgi:hypothetical protein